MRIVNSTLFQQVGEIFLSSKKRQDDAVLDFLKFYRDLVENTEGPVSAAFGKLSVEVIEKNKSVTWSIELNVSDYLFWKTKLTEANVRFASSLASIKTAMLERIVQAAERNKLTLEERKALLALLDPPENSV